MGTNQDDIYATIVSEFEDVLLNPITKSQIKTMISDNMEVITERRTRIGDLCRTQTENDMMDLFVHCRPAEKLMVMTYNKKLNEALKEFEDLDISEVDEKGNYTNTQRAFNLMAMIEKFHATIAKVSGLDSFRDLEVFRQKSFIAQQLKGGQGLLPDATPGSRPQNNASGTIIDMPTMD